MKTITTKRKNTWDIISDYRGVLMGISIICIMIFHYVEDYTNHYEHYTGWIRFFYNYISSSSVDTFLFLSGFGLYYSMKKKPDIHQFYKRRFTKILIPYFLVAIPTFFMNDIIHAHTGFNEYLADLSFYSFFTDGVARFWYILLILVCYLIFPFVFEMAEESNNRSTEKMRIINFFAFFTVAAIVLRLGNKSLYENVNVALLRVPFFFLGCFVGKSAYEKRTISGGTYGLMLFSLFMIQFRVKSKALFARYAAAFLNLSACIVIALLFKKLSRFEKLHNGIKKFFEWFGRYSLELYLTHVAIRSVMRDYGYHTYHVKYELFLIAVSIVSAVILNIISTYLNKCVSKILLLNI